MKILRSFVCLQNVEFYKSKIYSFAMLASLMFVMCPFVIADSNAYKFITEKDQYKKIMYLTDVGRWDPKNQVYLSGSVNMIARAGQYSQALSVDKDLEKYSPFGGIAAVQRAHLYYSMDDIDKADSLVKLMLKKYPNSTGLIKLKAKLAIRNRDCVSAKNDVNRLFMMHNDSFVPFSGAIPFWIPRITMEEYNTSSRMSHRLSKVSFLKELTPIYMSLREIECK